MPELSLQHIERIARDIRMQEIIFSHLADELIDHLCCDVESEMERGLSFNEAYRRVRQKMGSERLRDIQEETLYAVDTKYRIMKNTMKISGIAGTVLLGFAALFKVQHWPAAGIMLTLGALILAFVFMPSALVVLWKETRSGNRLVLFLSAFLAGGFFIIGTLFKVQHWPSAGIILTLAAMFAVFMFLPALLHNRFRHGGNRQKRTVYVIGFLGSVILIAGLFFRIMHWPLASVMTGIGLPVVFIIALPWYTWLTWKDEEHITSAYLYLVIGSLAILVPAVLLNLNVQYSYEDGFFKHQEQQNALSGYLLKNNDQLAASCSDSLKRNQVEELHFATIGIVRLVDAIKIRMVRAAESKPGSPDADISHIMNGKEIRHTLLSRPFHPGPMVSFLRPGCPSRLELDKAIMDYTNLLSEMIPDLYNGEKPDIPDLAGILPSDIEENAPPSLMSGLHTLEMLRNSLLAVEANMLNRIMENRQASESI